MPVREGDQISGKLTYLSLICGLCTPPAPATTTRTSIIAASLMEGDGKLTSLGLPASVEFLVVGGALSILSHLLGCLFLALYYSKSHTWREMGKEREVGKCGFISRICNQQDPVVAENPSWEQVTTIPPFVFFKILPPG